MVNQFGSGLYACVMDSYDYNEALRSVLPAAKVVMEKKDPSGKGFLVIRPDSGDPVEAVLQGLQVRARTSAFVPITREVSGLCLVGCRRYSAYLVASELFIVCDGELESVKRRRPPKGYASTTLV